MKRIIQLNCLIALTTVLLSVTTHAQQKPSQRSFSSVVDEIKEKQAARAKMIQQIKQTTPPNNNASQGGNLQIQPGPGPAGTAGAQQASQSVQRTIQQPVNNKINAQPQPSGRPKKE